MSKKRVHSQSRKETEKESGQVALPGVARRVYFPRAIMAQSDLDWFDSLAHHRIRFMTGGFMQIVRTPKFEAGTPKEIPMLVSDIEAAIRMHDHMLEQYRTGGPRKSSEVKRMADFGEIMRDANLVFAHWHKAGEATRMRLERKLASIVLDLEYCRNFFKVEVCSQAEAIMGFEDDCGRPNPGVMRARTVAALSRLEKRIEEVRAIQPRIALRRELLSLEKSRMEACLQAAQGQLRLVSRHAVFKNVSDEQAVRYIGSAGEIEAFNRRIGVALYYLETVYAAPYFGPARHVLKEFRNRLRPLMRSKVDIVRHRHVIRVGIMTAIRALTV